MKEMICICCPMGCHLSVDDSDKNNIKVSGNTCNRGVVYAKDEVTCPKRMVTAVVRVADGEINMVSVKTREAIEKSKIFDALAEIKGLVLPAPIKTGDIVKSNICGSGIDFVATKNVAKKA